MNDQLMLFRPTPHGSEVPVVRGIGQGWHDNSRASYHQPGAAQARGERLRAILAWLRDNGPATDREVARGLGFSDLNAVRPRITEGIACGAIREVGNTQCPVTGKTVRKVAVA